MKDEDILFQFDLGPMKKARALKSLNQILEETQFLKRETEQIENTEFMTDELRKRAFIRSFQVIEEAAEHITQDNRETIEISTRLLIGQKLKRYTKLFQIILMVLIMILYGI